MIELNQQLSCSKAGAAADAYVVAACDEVVDADGEVLALLEASPVLPVDHLELQDLRAAVQKAGCQLLLLTVPTCMLPCQQ